MLVGRNRGIEILEGFLLVLGPLPSIFSRFLGFAVLLPAFSGQRGKTDTSFS